MLLNSKEDKFQQILNEYKIKEIIDQNKIITYSQKHIFFK